MRKFKVLDLNEEQGRNSRQQGYDVEIGRKLGRHLKTISKWIKEIS